MLSLFVVYLSKCTGSHYNFYYHLDGDAQSQYVELCFTSDMAKVILSEHQSLHHGEVATLRVYLSDAVKRTVVVKDDDILTKLELQTHQREVSEATLAELKIWLTNNCFKKRQSTRSLLRSYTFACHMLHFILPEKLAPSGLPP